MDNNKINASLKKCKDALQREDYQDALSTAEMILMSYRSLTCLTAASHVPALQMKAKCEISLSKYVAAE